MHINIYGARETKQKIVGEITLNGEITPFDGTTLDTKILDAEFFLRKYILRKILVKKPWFCN